MQRLAALALVFLLSEFHAVAQENPAAVAQRASEAYAAGRHEEAAGLYRELRRLLPRSVSARIQLARALARTGRRDEALEQLGEAVDFGVRFDSADDAWSTLRTDPRFARLESRMRSQTAPLVRSETAFLLEKDLIPENIAWDPKSGAFYAGSMYKAKIIRIAPGGAATDFIPPRRDGLLSVLGMKIDPEKRELWAIAGNFIDSPPLEVSDPATHGQGAIFRFHLDSGKLIRKYPAPGGSAAEPMWFNDLVLAPNGDVYATAAGRGVWRLAAGADAIEPYVSFDGAFINGIAITPDGKTLFAASHTGGVIRIDTATKAATTIDVPRGVTLGGIDGLYFHEGSLVGVQNGTDPSRVIRAWLDPDFKRVIRFAVLEQAHPLSDIPLTGTIVGNRLYYVARSQLRAFENGRIWPAERLKESVILELPLDPPAPPLPDPAREQNALLEMHRGEIAAHVARNADWLADTTAEEFVSASRGKIDRTRREGVRTFFRSYFEGASYPQYEDLEPPVIRVSDDGSMAWILSRIQVRRMHQGRETSFVYAGVMMYEKRGDAWTRVANASTFE